MTEKNIRLGYVDIDGVLTSAWLPVAEVKRRIEEFRNSDMRVVHFWTRDENMNLLWDSNVHGWDDPIDKEN